MTEPSAQLEYGPRPAVHHRRVFKRVLIIMAVAVFAAAGWTTVPPLVRHLQLLHWQRQCLRYRPPPDRVILRLERKDQPGQVTMDTVVPPAWASLAARVAPRRGVSQGTAFLYPRRASPDLERLVVVDVFTNAAGGKRGDIDFVTRLIEPGRLGRSPVELAAQRSIGSISFAFDRQFRVFAGQPDPSDHSRFTIRYEWNGKAAVLYGQLRNDDTVRIDFEKVTAAR